MTRSRGFAGTLLSNKKIQLGLGGVILVVLVLFVGSKLTSKTNAGDSPSVTPSVLSSNKKNNQADVALATAEVGQSIDIPTGKGSNTISYEVVNAEILDSIIFQGERATAKPGKQFLVLNLKLSNDSENRVQIDTRDYLRLSVNGTEDRLAPSLYNEVEVQPISDQYTRVAYSVFKTDTDYTLYLGKISDEKIEIKLNFEN